MPSADPQWTAIVPLRLSQPKTRMGLTVDHARNLAVAFAADVLSALQDAGWVSVCVMDDSTSIAGNRIASVANIIDQPTGVTGLNAALDWAVLSSGVVTTDRFAVVMPDLAAMTAQAAREVRHALESLRSQGNMPFAYISDHHCIGTTIFSAHSRAIFRACFGGASATAYQCGGALNLADQVHWGSDSLARCQVDVDTVSDLRRALQLGVGEATSAQLSRLRGQISVHSVCASDSYDI